VSSAKSNPEPKRRAVFLDRDGTIAEEVGYANHISRFVVYPFAPAAIRRLNEADLPVIVVTNQSGVARGFFPESLIGQMHDKMVEELAAGGAHVDGMYYCPHIRGMLELAAREHNLEISGSVLVSDRYNDIQMGHDNGCRTILVLTGYGRGDYEWNRAKWPRQPDHVVENLADAVEIILKEMR
jgi:D-glycero-D-manno-heptose 1,7-bisphosphate phosphatase